MKQVSNQSVKALTETLVAHLQDNGYSACSREATMCLARHLSDFIVILLEIQTQCAEMLLY